MTGDKDFPHAKVIYNVATGWAMSGYAQLCEMLFGSGSDVSRDTRATVNEFFPQAAINVRVIAVWVAYLILLVLFKREGTAKGVMCFQVAAFAACWPDLLGPEYSLPMHMTALVFPNIVATAEEIHYWRSDSQGE